MFDQLTCLVFFIGLATGLILAMALLAPRHHYH
jgi:hypothetical protein